MSTISEKSVHVVSNTARDILQSAAFFTTLKNAVWEYVSNSLQYVDAGVSPKVAVTIDQAKKRVIVADNGRGMDGAGVQNYFTMHGHNLERQAGRPGRGNFGTGKSAAFGVGTKLDLRTVSEGKRTIVSLTLEEIKKEEAKGNVTSVPVRTIEYEEPTDESNGTVVTIEGVKAKCNVDDIIEFIERHLAHGFKDAEIIVNNHVVSYEEPSSVKQHRFTATGGALSSLGPVELVVKVSPSPLDEGRRGIDITSAGVLYETTLGTSEGKEMSQYLFGALEVPTLCFENREPTPAFTMARDMRLNLENPLVQAIHAFISVNVEAVRQELVADERARRQSEESKRLQRQADEIAKLLNEHFSEYSDKVKRTRSTVTDLTKTGGEDDRVSQGLDDLAAVFGGDDSVEVTGLDGEGGQREGGRHVSSPNPDPDKLRMNPTVEKHEDGDPLGDVIQGKKQPRRSGGGFTVTYKNLGEEENRAKYDRDTRSIIINLDFPQIALAKKDGQDAVEFRRLSNEVAVAEYAMALCTELITTSEFFHPSDVLFEIRATINKIHRRAAQLS
ncbi:MAG: ATP-binding protein [Vulcanimicrobiaceae bacterium]|jgi:hypothetical protein